MSGAGKRAAQESGQCADGRHDGVADGDRVAGAAGQVQQHAEAGAALDQRADRGAVVLAQDQVALPVTGHRWVGGLGGALADHDLVRDPPIGIGSAVHAALGPADRPAGAQTAGQFPAQRAAALHEQRAVDRLVTGLHEVIVGELPAQAGRDLLRRPALQQPRLNPFAQRLVLQLAPLRPVRPSLGGDLGAHRAIGGSPAGGPVPRDLSADLVGQLTPAVALVGGEGEGVRMVAILHEPAGANRVLKGHHGGQDGAEVLQ